MDKTPRFTHKIFLWTLVLSPQRSYDGDKGSQGRPRDSEQERAW